MPIFRAYPEAVGLQTTDAFPLDRIGVGTMYITAQDLTAGSSYVSSFEFFGVPPLTSELMGGHAFTIPVTMPINFAGSVGHCEVLPTATFTALVYQISGGVSTQIGTMTISTLGVWSWAVATATTFAIGDSIKFVAPVSTDASLANLWWSLLGVVA